VGDQKNAWPTRIPACLTLAPCARFFIFADLGAYRAPVCFTICHDTPFQPFGFTNSFQKTRILLDTLAFEMGLTRFHDMFHDMFVHWSGLGRAQGTKNEALPVTLQDPQKVPKPKYEATVLHSHPKIGYPKSTNGQYTLYHSTLPQHSLPVKQPAKH
jgi:hypothetical protein